MKSEVGVDVAAPQIAALRRLGRSWNEIASELGIGKGMAQRPSRQFVMTGSDRQVNPKQNL